MRTLYNIFKDIMNDDCPSKEFKLMLNDNLLSLFIPELMLLVDCKQNNWHAYDVWKHTMVCLDLCPKDFIVRTAALLHDVGKPVTKKWSEEKQDYTFIDHEIISADMAESILHRLEFPEEDIQQICHLIRNHLILYESAWSSAAIRRFIKKVGKENLNNIFSLARADAMAKGNSKKYLGLEGLDELMIRVNKELSRDPKPIIKKSILNINGKDIMDKLNIESGPMVGNILKTLTELAIKDPEINNDKNLLLKTAAIIHQTISLKSKK